MEVADTDAPLPEALVGETTETEDRVADEDKGVEETLAAGAAIVTEMATKHTKRRRPNMMGWKKGGRRGNVRRGGQKHWLTSLEVG